MRNIRTFEQFSGQELLLTEFEKYLPKQIRVLKEIEGQLFDRIFKIGNVMRNANMTQIIYAAEKSLFGHPDEMSIDIYYLQNSHIKLEFDIIYGDVVSCEFSCEPPNKVTVIQYTSYGSKWDPSNTMFALSEETIESICDFINMIDGFNIAEKDLYFLSKNNG